MRSEERRQPKEGEEVVDGAAGRGADDDYRCNGCSESSGLLVSSCLGLPLSSEGEGSGLRLVKFGSSQRCGGVDMALGCGELGWWV